MKKPLLILILLHTIFSFSQENIFGNSPVEGIIPIKRSETENNLDITNTVLSQSSNTPPPASPTGNSDEVGVTAGQLSVSLTGGAVYEIPIAVPPGINGVVPQVSLSYNSQASNGLAGYGWNITGISVITRIPATKFHDGTIDAVDFDGLDRFSLDGQRLVVKNGTSGVYGTAGTIYETESFSNIKVTSYGVHPNGSDYGPSYFKVEYPDGSSAIYGNGSNSRSRNDWAITYWQNPQGVRISYTYTLSNNNLSISTIRYGSRLTTTPVNEISFVYKVRERPEQAYIGGQNFIRNTILSEIKVKGNNVGFRNYLLTHETTSLGYQILKSITERSGDNTKSLNPTIFNYDMTTNDDLFSISDPIPLSVGPINFQNSSYISGDFNGDGNMDFILYPTTGTNAKKRYWLFDDVQGTSMNIGYEHPIGQFVDIFPTSWLNYADKLMPTQGWCVIQYNATNNITSFKNFSKGVALPIYSQHERTYEFPKLSYIIECPDLPHCDLNPFPENQQQNNTVYGREPIPLDPLDPLNPVVNCPNPTNISLSPILNNQATLTWSQNGTPSPVMWEVYYFETGTANNPSNNDPIGTYTTTNQNSLLITNLSARKNYTFFVRSICLTPTGYISGVWVGPYNAGGLIITIPGETKYQTIPKEFVSGDFNGDGLTDVIAIDKSTSYQTRLCQGNCYTNAYTSVPGGKTYFVNLDTRLTDNFVNYSGYITITNNSKFVVADVNGDGKSDLLVFDPGNVKVYSLNDNNQLVLLFNLSDSAIKSDKPMFLGDFNGDGKSDFLIPQQNNVDSWSFFLSKGNDFHKITSSIGLPYQIANGGYYGVVGFPTNTYSLNEHSYVVNDFNGDGKSDILYQQNLTVEYVMTSSGADYTNYGNPQLTYLVLLENKLSSNTSIDFNIVTTNSSLGGIRRNPVPIFLDHNNVNKNLEYGLISGNSVRTFKSTKNNKIDTSLKEIILGNGVKNVITYQPLNSHINSSGNSFEISAYEPSTYTETYPSFDIHVANNFHIVSKLEQVSDDQYKQQRFKYYGAVSNLEGLGFLGFRELHKTNWFNDTNQVITTVTKHDITKRGAVSETYTLQGQYHPFNYNPTSYITKSVMTYEDELLPNKVYKIKNTESRLYNALENSSKKILTTYDSYTNPLNIVSSFYNSPTLHGSSIRFTDSKTLQYDNNTTGSGVYYIGRPKKVTTILQAFGINGSPPLYIPPVEDTRTSEETYTYNSSNLLTKVQKKGHNTGYLTEDNVYDIFGNITKKTITANGLTPRITEYTYDNTGRFLLTGKDIEGLITTYSYNTSNGNVLSEILPHNSGYPLTTTFEYDVWGRRTKVADYLGKKVTTSYFKHPNSNILSVISNTSDSGNISFEMFNQLGNKIATTIRDISGNNWSAKLFQYDVHSRIIQESEPFFVPDPLDNLPASQWNTTAYDIYGRVTQQTLYTGKTTNITYNGLTTTSDDGVKTTTVTKNAVGHITSLTDNGGTITYKYYADGNLKESDYGGIVVSVEQDGWGRKTKLTDPSAGIYTYQYNDFGELTKETTPKGETNYTLDNFGKVSVKTITGDNTNSVITYTYNPTTKLLTDIFHVDSSDSSQTIYTSYTYGYDNYRRLNITEESSGTAFFQKMFYFDSFGRIDKEYSRAVNVSDMKTSENVIKNTYKNGYHWQILDDATNQVLWQTNSTDARGQLTGGQFGNGVMVTNTYDQYGLPTLIKHQKTGGVNPINMQLGTTFDAQRGNLMSRTNNLFAWSENFQYDDMDRLTHYKNASGNVVEQVYDNRGRITENSLGDYEYFNNSYRNKSIDLNAESEAYYKLREGVFFDTMESQSGWAIYDSGVTYDTTFSNQDIGGTTSLKIVNNSPSQEIVVQSQVWIPINNSQPTQYTYSGWIYSNGPQVELFLLMKDANETGYMTMADNVVSNTTGQWQYVEKTFTVPANIRYINFRVDNNGKKNGGTTTWFDNVKIRKTENAPTDSFLDRHLDISYNTFKAPVDIFEPGIERLSFRYNAFGQRSTMFYGSLQENKMQRPLRKHYSADGSMEIKQNIQTGEVEFITYIGGDGYSAPVVFRHSYPNMLRDRREFLYLHRDFQGTIIAISNQAGQVVEKRLFDAWGNVLKVQDGTGRTLPGFVVLDRGYTGHEHLQGINIIHMNGRLYDPVVHRFLQPDNFIQDPFNTQNFNRYGYCLNNPFMYTDPSGEEFITAAVIIGAIVGAYFGGVSANGGEFNPGKWNWNGKTIVNVVSGAVIGALSGGAANQIATSGVVFANTKAILVSSAINGIGTNIYTGGQSEVMLSLGVVSFNFSRGEFGYLGKKGNSFLENLGYGLGALANLQDAVAGINGTNIDVNSADTRKPNEWWGHSSITDDNNSINISVGPNEQVPSGFGALKSVEGKVWSNYADSPGTWKVSLNNVNEKILTKFTSNIDNSKNLLGGSLKWSLVGNSCVNYTSRALLFAGIPTLPINIHPHILNIQLSIRQIGMYGSPYLLQNKNN